MTRGFFVLFGVAAYLIFFATFLYLVGFVGNLPYLPVTIDRGPASPAGMAILVDLALIALFGVQHSVMARQGFKRAWTRIVPSAVERSVYVLAASAVLIVLFLLWRPIGKPVWSVENRLAADVLWGVFGLGWAMVLLTTFLLSHFELFGLKQVWLNLKDREAAAPQLRRPLFYHCIRHPLYTGFLLAFWATPVMSAGHLLFALGMTGYILIAIRYEERDLVGMFGRDYERYREEAGMLAPKLRRRRG
ncbi:MAG: isoprenylcysteine carboxylmethyltransferase family protein [Pseudomonadota bacterium]